MTLHRWHELECGDGNDYASWCVVRGRKVDGNFVYDENGKLPGSGAFEERHVHTENKARYTRIPDRERGALKRLAKIVVKYPGFAPYVQGDPRGPALYILRPTDWQIGDDTTRDLAEIYTRGIAVYK